MSNAQQNVSAIKLVDSESNTQLLQFKSFFDKSEITTSSNIPLLIGVQSLSIVNHNGDSIIDVVKVLKKLDQRIEYLETIILNHFS